MNNKGISGIVLLFVIVIGFIVGSICWPYTINTWLVFFGKNASIVWWQGGLLGLAPIIGQFSLPAAIVTWIIMLFL